MISIIGGGPAGSMTAIELARRGIRSQIIEEHKNIGKPVQCTGIVTDSILSHTKISKKLIINKIKTARIHCNERYIDLSVRDLVLDRTEFDKELFEKAVAHGSSVIRRRIESVNDVSNGVVVGADGPNSIIRKFLNPKLKVDYLIGKQALIKGNFDKNIFHVFLGSVAPGFFAWVVPENESYARVGLASRKNTHKYFDKFYSTIMNELTEKSKIVSHQGGLIPIYNPHIKTFRKTTKKKMYIVGDAALQVKATTGGGIIPALRSAKILARSISEQNNYESSWRKELGKGLYAHLLLRKHLNKFSDEMYKSLISDLDNKKIKKLFMETNRDNAIEMLLRLAFTKPSLVKYLI